MKKGESDEKFEEFSKDEINQAPSLIEVGGLNFRDLVQAEKFDFRNNSKLRKKIEKAFLNGLGKGTDNFAE